MTPRHLPLWLHTEDDLFVRVGHRREQVPPVIAGRLTAPGGLGTSADPARDLLELEARFRADIAAATLELAGAEKLVQLRRTQNADKAGPRRSPAARRRRRQSRQNLIAAVAQHTAAATALEQAHRLQRVLRTFVIHLNPRSGLLAEAARGWSRSADAPGSVVVFADEDAFLSGDRRRGDDTFGFPLLAGADFGRQWRRDDDEPDAAALDRAGPWAVLYLARTGEIYATRRSSALGAQVWLLGTGFHDPAVAHALLTELESRMREPNSLVLAAQRVHAARPVAANRLAPGQTPAATSITPQPGPGAVIG